MSVLLDVQKVTMHFGGVHALTDVSFQVMEGEFLSLIGPNGAGKTTMLRAITGVVHPQTADIHLDGKTIIGLPTHKRASLGLAMTNQIVSPFKSMTLRDNVALAVGHERIATVFKAVAAMGRSAEHKKAGELLHMVGIGEHADQEVVGQPLGLLKRLEVARALALKPKLLLLDEPLAGLNHVEAERMADVVVGINREGLTVVMIEHNLGEVLRISDRLVVLDNGRKIAEGKPETVMRMPHVRAAYVGMEAENAEA
ncbi:MAG: ATP-binding cassette domain-containing protein [Thermodesulfobacteriota bacterium]